MKAIVIGATGATGKDLVQVLLNDNEYTEVVIFVRKSSRLSHPKLKEVITNFDKPEEVAEMITGDVWFSTLGTTMKAAGTKEKQWHIDHDIPLSFAKIAKRNGVHTAVLLSAYGASTSSNIFYSKMKGSLEEKIDTESFNTYVILKPGLLLRDNTDRWVERLSGSILKTMNSIGLFKKFRPMPTLTLAEKMAKAPKVFSSGKHVIELNKIFDL
jgi:uncharacterized protein YbjT (DUF2867 family)